VFGAQSQVGSGGLGYAFLVALVVIGGLFFVIECTALVMGMALARSITGAVHELFVGTEHVRDGDFGHRIIVRTHDQLGELADSFNAMTGSVKNLLREAAEKKRLEEELRIARRIQMSLLPRDTTTIAGVTVSATCVPAREVGGDYYEFVRLGDHRLGILVADVSGKGTSAAFYMAELKGVFLSLSRIHGSPKQLLVEVNRIIAPHIDDRSFITMMYVVLDLEQNTLTYARAGHTPLIYVRGESATRKAEVLAPSGLVVGLDGFQTQFDELIEEDSLDVGRGDVAVLFTDGISEAMNDETDLFGEERLGALVESHASLDASDLRDQILASVKAFVGDADQHDDMTLVLFKIDEIDAEAT
jgi:sigma-B regulation protein RsbU (phosphoserine phosphatase)